MVEEIELSEDNGTFSKILVDDIIERAFKAILDQSESSYIPCQNVQYGSSKMTSTSMKDICTASQVANRRPLIESCYSSISKHPEVCIHTSSLSSSSKQGEGDVQNEGIMEMDNLGSSTHSTPTCSINSDDELLHILQNNSHDLSFDNIQFSDSEIDDGFIEGKTFEASNHNHPIEDVVEKLNTREEQYICNNTFLQQSPKFYHPINAQCSLENSWEMTENKVPEKEIITIAQSPELLGDEQLDEEIEQIEAHISKNPINDPSRNFIPPNYVVYKTAKMNDKAELLLPSSKEDIQWDWEEAVEVQVGMTEPEIENQETIQIKTDWSDVGLIEEYLANPKHSGPLSGGKECDPGVENIHQTHLDNNSGLLNQAHLPEEFPNHYKQSDSDQPVNYLSFPIKDKNKNKNNKFFARLASAVFSRFRREHTQRKTKITV